MVREHSQDVFTKLTSANTPNMLRTAYRGHYTHNPIPSFLLKRNLHISAQTYQTVVYTLSLLNGTDDNQRNVGNVKLASVNLKYNKYVSTKL